MKHNYSEEELKILEDIEDGKYISIENLEEAKNKYSQYAFNTCKINKNVNIKISERDFNSLQVKAMEEGIPYQTFISSLLHKYISGRLVDVNMVK